MSMKKLFILNFSNDLYRNVCCAQHQVISVLILKLEHGT